MTIIIRKVVGDIFKNHKTIVKYEWDIRKQIEALEAWLNIENNKLDTKYQWVADIGFRPSAGALGGGPPITKELMKKCLNNNLEIYLSEYPRAKEELADAVELRKQILEGSEPNSTAIQAAEKLILMEVEDDLHTFSDEPEHNYYTMALLQKEAIESSDSKTKRILILFFLQDLMIGSEGQYLKYAETLFDKISNNLD